MTGPANALQPAGHRWWCLYLDHQIDRAHVDAQLQAGRRHHRFELPAFEVLFDNGALLLADRAMVGAGQHRRRSERLARAHDVRRGAAGNLLVGVWRELNPAARGVNFVEPCGKSLGQSSRIGEHDGRVV